MVLESPRDVHETRCCPIRPKPYRMLPIGGVRTDDNIRIIEDGMAWVGLSWNAGSNWWHPDGAIASGEDGSMKKIEVHPGFLYGLGGVAALALLALAFLLGRTSASRPAAQAGASAQVPSGDSAQASVGDFAQAPAGAGVQGSMDPRPSDGVPAPASAPSSAMVPVAVVIPPPEPKAALDAHRPAVVGYFRAMDGLQAGHAGRDPESMAKDIVGSMLKGDDSGFDDMAKQARGVRAKLAALTPPAPCAAYHRESLALLDEELGLMQSMKTVLNAPNPVEASGALTTKANALKARTDALQALEKTLRQRYGVGM